MKEVKDTEAAQIRLMGSVTHSEAAAILEGVEGVTKELQLDAVNGGVPPFDGAACKQQELMQDILCVLDRIKPRLHA